MDVSVRRSGQSTITSVLTVVGCSVFFFCAGLGVGFAVWGSERVPTEESAANETTPSQPTQDTRAAMAPSDPEMAHLESVEEVWPARHLFVSVAGTSVNDDAREMLASLKPGGVVLTQQNIQANPQAKELIGQIKAAVALGDNVHDLPLIAAAQEGGIVNRLNLATAPGAREIASRRNLEHAKEVGKTYADASMRLGVGVMLAPVLDIFADGAPARMESRTFGTDEKTVTAMGLWFASGVIEGGVIPVAKHYPGIGSARFSARNPLPVLNQSAAELAITMYPFADAAGLRIPGILAGHVSVPKIDMSDPPRPASLSPTMINTVLRNRWGYNGVIVADDIALEAVTQSYSLPDAAVEALASGCDAVIVTETDPAVIREICERIESAVASGELAASALRDSKKRLDNWQAWLKSPTPMDGTLPNVLPEPGQTPEPPTASEPEPAPAPDTEPEPEEPMPVGDESEVIYTVEPGDALSKIAAKFEGVSTSDIIEWNGLSNANIRVGQELRIRVRDDAMTPEPEPQIEAPEPVNEEPAPEPEPVEPEPTPEPEPNTPTEVTEYIVESGDVLSRIAAKFDVTTQQIMEWNGLENTRLYVGQKLTIGEAATTEPEPAPEPDPETTEPDPAPEEPAEAPADPAPEPESTESEMTEYTVKSGDVLSRIAANHNVTTQQLMEWNGLESSRLSVGQKLMIGGAAPQDSEPEPEPAPEPEPETESTPEPEPTVEEPQVDAPQDATEYVVQSGDALSKIASKFNVTTQQIMDWNELSSTQIRVGQTLKIVPGTEAEPAEPDTTPEPQPEPEPEPEESTNSDVTQKKHSVQLGESLSGIAAAYGVSVSDLIEWNDLDSEAKLQAGRVLTIYVDPAREQPESAFGQYVIQSGDSPLSIAQQYGISPEELMRMNGVTDVNDLRVGQTLRVPKTD